MSRLTLEWHLRGIMEGVPGGAYSTGWPSDGRTCDAFDVPASEALRSDDPVAYLDAVSHDPIRRHQERYDAAQLLDHHIWPDSPKSDENGVIACERDDIDISEWLDAEMVGRSVGPTYFAMRCVNSDCMEGECLADPDTLRDEGKAVCMLCGTQQPEPVYP